MVWTTKSKASSPMSQAAINPPAVRHPLYEMGALDTYLHQQEGNTSNTHLLIYAIIARRRAI